MALTCWHLWLRLSCSRACRFPNDIANIADYLGEVLQHIAPGQAVVSGVPIKQQLVIVGTTVYGTMEDHALYQVCLRLQPATEAMPCSSGCTIMATHA